MIELPDNINATTPLPVYLSKIFLDQRPAHSLSLTVNVCFVVEGGGGGGGGNIIQ